ncbi:EpsG family protein [Rodentibacter pneumotropicus]|nr:EpsG family protein [Rodentibacter pneumotropicus]NBH74442.1 hypothetical protein [Rodentibacter pneumotropicus]
MILYISFINIIFPVFGLAVSLFYFFYKRMSSSADMQILFINISYSLGVLGYLYIRRHETGDIYQYYLAFESLKENLNFSELYSEYSSYYFSWVSLLGIAAYFNLEFQKINFICIFTIYISILTAFRKLYDDDQDITSIRIIFFKLMTMVSFITIISSYRNILAFSISFLGLIYILKNKQYIVGLILIIVGIGFHPSSIIIPISLLVSRVVLFRKKYLIVCLLLGMFIPKILEIFTFNNAYFSTKINEYIYGQWATYSFNSLIDYSVFIGIYSFILFCFIAVIFLEKLKVSNPFKKDLLNFIFTYFSISILFLQFKTISDRLMFSAGGFILILLGYFLFINRMIYKKKITSLILLIIWYVYIDPQLINFKQDSYSMGDGVNIIYSPIFSFFS